MGCVRMNWPARGVVICKIEAEDGGRFTNASSSRSLQLGSPSATLNRWQPQVCNKVGKQIFREFVVQGLILLGTFNLSSAALIESWDIFLFRTEIQLCAAPPLNVEVPKCRGDHIKNSLYFTLQNEINFKVYFIQGGIKSQKQLKLSSMDFRELQNCLVGLVRPALNCQLIFETLCTRLFSVANCLIWLKVKKMGADSVHILFYYKTLY